jgi:hydroxyacylglutathione hydrolase
MSQLIITPIPALADNYIWLLQETNHDRALVVDPGSASPVLAYLQAHHLTLDAILITHHHQDHCAGVAELVRAYPAVRVIGPVDQRIHGLTHHVIDQQSLQLPDWSFSGQVLAIPGHTSTHVGYIIAEQHLFCGDTLFAGGCGRVFDGTPEQLAESLQRLAQLPPTTACYSAHEYTLANLGFARWVEADNPTLMLRIKEVTQQRQAQQPTLPTSLQIELLTNPFLRTHEPVVIAAAEKFSGQQLTDFRAVFAALRRWKDIEYD